MKILFGASPAAGHLLPLLPLADAAADAGHDVAFLTDASMAPLLGARRLLPAGPALKPLIAENLRRVGSGRTLGPESAELLAGTRVDLTWDEALAQAQRHQPDLIVGEWLDFVTPLLAARLDVPWAAHTVCGPMPSAFTDALPERAERQHASRSLKPRDRIALLDLFPDALRLPTDTAPEPDRIPIRPGGIAVEVAGQPSRAIPPRTPGVPRALLTMGTSVGNPDLVSDLARSVAEAGIEVLVTANPDDVRPTPGVHAIGFTPLTALLADADVVIGAAGSGTLLATLAAGVPSVLFPVLADQPLNATRAVHRGTARVIEAASEAGPAARRVLDDPGYREAAREVARETAEMLSPGRALGELLARCR